ncbi:MAG TPA: sigma-70 family RNA polymerase sigma factor [Verrucomicrobiae bacterium]|jgi:RNA polymerase sigma factor (sigma-70 family)|nr:sigma-70 family RNA polymerase sigma factor [Verrucomicrobiae bacterium]
MMTSDTQLLRSYVRKKSQDAFTELVRRHLDLVYSAALRQVRSPQLAEEISQSVFADLARGADKLKSDTLLTAWLYQVTRRTAIDVVRRESRRQARERLAVEMADMNTATDWPHIEPLLDDAMEALDEPDRAAILLRYFENKSLREVGQSLGTSDDAAQKRVSRAVERLREFFSKRGVTIGAGGIIVLISANAVQSAPLALAATISAAAAVLAGTAVHTSTAISATKAIAMTALQKTLVTATIAILAGAGIYEARQMSQLSGQVRTLQQQQAPLIAQIRQLKHERDDAEGKLATVQDGKTQSNRDEAELLRLRGEVTQLRSDLTKRSDPNMAGFKGAPNLNAPFTRYYINYAPLKAVMRTKLATMYEQLRLSAEQMQAIEGIVTNLSSKDPERQINALLSPEQQTAYDELKQKEAISNLQARLHREVGELQYGLKLTAGQMDQVSSALYDVELNDTMAKLDGEFTADPITVWEHSAARWEQLNEKKFNALTNILSPPQLYSLRAWQADDVQMQKSNTDQVIARARAMQTFSTESK